MIWWKNGITVQYTYTFLYSEGTLHETKCSIELINNSVSFSQQIRLPSDTNEHVYSMEKLNFVIDFVFSSKNISVRWGGAWFITAMELDYI